MDWAVLWNVGLTSLKITEEEKMLVGLPSDYLLLLVRLVCFEWWHVHCVTPLCINYTEYKTAHYYTPQIRWQTNSQKIMTTKTPCLFRWWSWYNIWLQTLYANSTATTQSIQAPQFILIRHDIFYFTKISPLPINCQAQFQ